MTFVIAKIVDPDAGKVTLLSDTKLTHQTDDRYNRRSLSNPCQKVVIVDDDVAVAFAGDTPESALKRVVELRGQTLSAITAALLSFTTEMQELRGVSKSFLIVARTPSPRITVISNGKLEDRTDVGTGWIGDPDAFHAFSEVFHDPTAPADRSLEERFFMAMVNLIGFEDIETVGGYLVRVSGSTDQPLRFCTDPAFMMPDDLEGTIVRQPGRLATLKVSLAEGADPTRHIRIPIPGTDPTYSALAHYIPEANTAWLHTHERPGESPISLAVQSLSELTEVARINHGQYLDPAAAERFLRGLRPSPSSMYMRPYPQP
ncbi:hypothetical protein [Mycolicibacterium sp.]|uniref:hypothetical protein n=1 Tax=Mycolicibacterium sp. TaxID=2320850 RepID=UPI0037C9B73B